MLVLQPGKMLEQRSAVDLRAARVAQRTARELMKAAVGFRRSAAVTAQLVLAAAARALQALQVALACETGRRFASPIYRPAGRRPPAGNQLINFRVEQLAEGKAARTERGVSLT